MAILTNSGKILVSNGNLLSIATLPLLPNFSLNNYKPGSNTDNIVISNGAIDTYDDVWALHPCAVLQGGTVYLFYSGYDGASWKIGVATENKSGFTGINFVKYGSNPILSNGVGGSWDETGVLDPWVIYDADAGIWKMWFRGISGGGAKIGYAIANSPFGPWTKYGNNPILQASAAWEGTQTILPSVIRKSANDYVMLYAGNDPSFGSKIGVATSTNGISWTKDATNPVIEPSGDAWMAASVFSPRTFIYQNNTYYAYYSAKGNLTPYHIDSFSKSGLAISNDLQNWTVNNVTPLLTASRTWEGVALPPGETENPNAIHISPNWYIFYDCYFGSPSGIGVAIVPD